MTICTWWIPRCGWPAGKRRLELGHIDTHDDGAMVYAEHHFSPDHHLQITTSMHRRAGSQRECVQAVTDGALYDITDMREWREEKGSGVRSDAPRPAGKARWTSAVLAGCGAPFY